jgi:hypothetical protein
MIFNSPYNDNELEDLVLAMKYYIKENKINDQDYKTE